MYKVSFTNPEYDAFYARNGYVHIPGFLNPEQVRRLRELYFREEYSEQAKGFHRTLDLLDLEKKKRITAGIDAVVTPESDKHLVDYRFFLTSFMTKEKGADAFDIHQNWTFVDESKFASVVIWIPLQPVSEANGTMYFVPGSDQWKKPVRGNNIVWAYENEKKDLMKKMVPVPMEAGDAVIFDDATIHYTSANRTNEPRISIAQVMIPKAAQPVFYNYDTQTKKLQQYAIDDNFYLEFTNRYLSGKGFQDVQLVETY